jgi:hypothetical protein
MAANGENEPTAEQVAVALGAMFSDHQDCKWEQVGPCVYCAEHFGVRLYQGDLPESRRTTPPCTEHRWDDGDSMCQGGFYLLCLDCGAQEWTE